MLSKNLIIASTLLVGLGCRSATTAGMDGGGGGLGGGGGGGGGDLAAPTAGDGGDAGGAADLAVATGLLYDVDGPEPYMQLQLTASGGGKSIPIVVYLPSTAGVRPAVMLSSGLQQPGAAYAPYARRLASWGIVAVLRDDPGVLSSAQSVADDITFVVGWLPSATAGGLTGRIDAARIGLAGHSRGGMASLLAIEGGAAHVRGFFGIDPVDNSGMAAKGAGSIGVPSVFLGETTDGAGGMACAPADQNYDVLWKAAPPPSLELTAVGADHTQFEDPASCAFCTLCTKGSADGAEVLRESVRALAAFFARELLGDARLNATLGAAVAGDVASGRMKLLAK